MTTTPKLYEVTITMRVHANSIKEAHDEVQSFMEYGMEVGNDCEVFRNFTVGEAERL